MICYEQKTLDELIKKAKPLTKHGKVADYIPALGEANGDTLAISIYTTNGECFSAGNSEEKFTLQSISKVITLAMVLIEKGEEYVFSRVGMEPTGDPFNSIAKLETLIPSKPLNPMINAGALAVTNMITGTTVDEKISRILSFVQDLTNNKSITYNGKVAQSEFDTANLNRALSYFMKQHGVVQGNVDELLDVYTKQCAIEVDCKDLAKIGYVIANEGVNPETNKRIIPLDISRIIKTFMVTCGMYNASGEFAIKVGIPAKSGVSGAVLGAVPHGMGIGIYGPALDEKGNSIAGLKLLESISKQFNLSIF